MNFSSKIPLYRVITMTLDEYIQESGIFRNPIPPHYESPHDTEDRFEDITDEIVVKQEPDVEMLESFDLRNKISSNNPEQLNIRSQQWRLVSPNKSPNRPPGMPPLVPRDKEAIPLNNSKPFKRKWGNRWNHNNRNRRQEYQNPRNNGDTQENSQSTSFFQRIGCRPPKNSAGQYNTMGARQSNQTLSSLTMNMKTEDVCNYHSLNNPQSNNSSARNQPLENNIISNSLGLLQPSNSLNDSGGINLQIMPYLAAKLLEQFQSTPTPKYDLSVQKEIHNIQNKTMAFKCPGGDVISSDGPGLPCKMTPKTTGISLNHRFA